MTTTHQIPAAHLAGTPEPGQVHPHTLRTASARWWKPVVGILGGVLVFLVVSVVSVGAALVYEGAVGDHDVDHLIGRLTPAMYAATLLSPAVLIPITWVLVRFLHRQPWGFTGSVEGRFRWGLVLRPFPVTVIAFVLYLAGFLTLAPDMGRRSDAWIAYAVISVLLMPVQAAAEEIFFRGYVQRGVGSWFSSERTATIVGTVVSGLCFAAAHFAQDLWLNAYYLAFGVTLSIAARLTGGLEIPILLHVVNNLTTGVVGAYATDMNRAFDRSAGVGGPYLLVQMAFIALAAFVLIRWVRSRGALIQVAAPATAGMAPVLPG